MSAYTPFSTLPGRYPYFWGFRTQLDPYWQACQWASRGRTRAGRYAGKSIFQRDWFHRQHDKFHWKSRRQKFLFFSEDSKEICPYIFVSAVRKVKPWIEQNILLLLFISLSQISGVNGKNIPQCYWSHQMFETSLAVCGRLVWLYDEIKFVNDK